MEEAAAPAPSVAAVAPGALSDYELQRLHNVERNNELLRQLGIAPLSNVTSPSPQAQERKPRVRKDWGMEPKRHSERVFHAPAVIYDEDAIYRKIYQDSYYPRKRGRAATDAAASRRDGEVRRRRKRMPPDAAKAAAAAGEEVGADDDDADDDDGEEEASEDESKDESEDDEEPIELPPDLAPDAVIDAVGELRLHKSTRAATGYQGVVRSCDNPHTYYAFSPRDPDLSLIHI